MLPCFYFVGSCDPVVLLTVLAPGVPDGRGGHPDSVRGGVPAYLLRPSAQANQEKATSGAEPGLISCRTINDVGY